MRILLSCLLLGVATPLLEATAQQNRVPTSQEEIASHLRSTDIGTIDLGIRGAIRIAPEQWTPALRRAILYALESEYRRDEEAARAGVYRFTDDGLVAPLAELAVVMQDPAAIPLLAEGALMVMPRSALVSFGRQALPDLVRVAREGDYDEVMGVLIVLRQMIQAWGVRYLTAQERAQLKAVAALYLSPDIPQVNSAVKNPPLKYVAQLALVLDDAEARAWVEDLVAGAAPLQAKLGRFARGNRAARELLGGAPMLPESTPLSVYLTGYRELYGHNWEQ